MAEHNDIGKRGEEIAVVYLKKKGYQIIYINWQEKKFEVDIIAQDKNDIVFVEVKTRSTDFFGQPEEAVTPSKQKHLIEGANYYIEKNEIDLNCRFDVVAVIINSKGETVNHIKDAFYPEVS